MLLGTEADIVDTVARLKEATREHIRRKIGFSPAYIEFLCRYLVRKGYLTFSNGRYFLPRAEMKTQFTEQPKINNELIKEIVNEVVKEISGRLKKTVSGIKIKTGFEFPVEDESLALESNIDKIGVRVEKEISDIDRLVKLFKEIKKKGGRDD
jgi:uncharacterized protein YneF (UPF0154 family)